MTARREREGVKARREREEVKARRERERDKSLMIKRGWINSFPLEERNNDYMRS